MPAPIPANEARRLQALRDCCVLDTAPEEGFDDITAMAAEAAGTPMALISLIDEDRQWFKSRIGLDAPETPRDLAFCAYAILEPGPLVIEDARLDERFRDHPLVVGPPKIRFYAGFPLELRTGERLGTLCVIDDRPRTLVSDRLRLLHRLAREAATSLELRRSLVHLERVSRDRATIIDELRHTQERLAASNRAKSEFLANMSHEIRTPMTAIIGFLDLIDECGADEAQRRAHVATVRRNARHLLGLINGILDLSKVEAGRMTVERLDTSPLDVVREVEALHRVAAQRKGLDLRVEIDTPIPRVISTDPMRLHQIISNLVSNAVKFTDTGGITVRLSLEPVETENWLRIAVADSGIGIAPQHRRRLFEAFEQGDTSTTRRFGGTGLGLKIAHRLAELLGGRLTLSSEPGAGSTFTFVHPVGASAAQDLIHPDRSVPLMAPKPKASPPAHGDPAAPLHGRRVLVADDAPDNRRLLEHYLQKAGADVVAVEDGVHTLAAIAQAADEAAPFDLVVLDMQMPRLDGFGAARALRETGHTVAIIALTAGAMAGDRARCLQAGCDDYLAKPINPPEFVRRCATLATPALRSSPSGE